MKVKTSDKQLRDFGKIVGLGLPIFVGFIIPFLTGHSFAIWTIFVGLIIFTVGIIKPSLLFFPYKYWMLIGNLLGWINSRLILGLVFILVLQPISILMKIFRYDPLKLKKSNVKSYKANINNKKIDFTKTF